MGFPRWITASLFFSSLLWANPSDYCPQPPWCYQNQSRFSPGERTVCGDEILSIEDNLLSSIYRHLQFVDRDMENLRREEAEWLRLRNSMQDRDLLMLLYADRIKVLSERLARDRGSL